MKTRTVFGQLGWVSETGVFWPWPELAPGWKKPMAAYFENPKEAAVDPDAFRTLGNTDRKKKAPG